MADTSTRFQISEPSADRHDAADVPLYIRNVVAALEAKGTIYGQGLLSARPTSSGGSPGVQGRVYYATDTLTLYYDFGTGWTALGTSTFSGYGTLASRPSASTQPDGWFYYATDVKQLYQNEASTWTLVSSISQYSTSVGDGVSTSYVINHNLGSQSVVVQVRQASTPFAVVHPDIQITDANNVTLVFDAAPSSGQYSVIVLGGATGTPAVSAHASTHLPNGSDALAWSTIHGRGTLAARPAAGATNSGLRYVATDVRGGTEYQSDGAAWNQVSRSQTDELGYVEFTADVAFNAVTDIVSLGSITYDGGLVMIEVYIPEIQATSSVASLAEVKLDMDGADLGIIAAVGQWAWGSGNLGVAAQVLARRRLTPAAGAHTIKARAISTGGAATAKAGAGGAATLMPGYIRAEKI